MAVFTSNQVNHVYIAKVVKATKASLANPGDIFVGKTKDNELYFVYKNAKGGIVRSDLIPIKNVMWAKAVSGDDNSQKRFLKQYTITINSLDGLEINKDSLTVVLEMDLHNGVESIYRKTATVLIKSATIATVINDLYTVLKKSFEKDDYVKDLFDITLSGTTITVTEKSQSATYKPGLYANEAVNFRMFSEESQLVITGAVSQSFVGNSYDIADLEYFALGERGDVYRNVGWPNANPSATLATYGDDVKYNILNIHFAFVGSNESVQKSEKDITIAIAESDNTNIDSLLGNIATLVTGTANDFKLATATSKDLTLFF